MDGRTNLLRKVLYDENFGTGISFTYRTVPPHGKLINHLQVRGQARVTPVSTFTCHIIPPYSGLPLRLKYTLYINENHL
jgi:hypothetical protein